MDTYQFRPITHMNITTRDLIINKTKSGTKLKEYKSNHTYIAIIVGLQNSQIGVTHKGKQEIQEKE